LTDLANLIAIGVGAFVATNIDDIFVLMMFFSSTSTSSSSMNFPVRQVGLGQYMGIGLLIAISALGSLIPLVVPPYVIGLLGIVPIVIGSKRLVQMIKKETKYLLLQCMQCKTRTIEGTNCIYLFWLLLL
jgi:cadmium resistance protein CadD (predicted permease)